MTVGTSSPTPSSLRPHPWALDFVLLAAVWGGSFLFMQLGAREFGALPTAALRVGVAACFLAPIVAVRGLVPVMLANWKPLLFVGVFNSAMPFALYCWALTVIPTALSALLNATVPLFGALVAWAWLGDRPLRSRLLGLVIGFTGVALLATNKGSFMPNASVAASLLAVLACLGAAVSYAVSASFTKKHLLGVPSLAVAGGSQITATLALAVPAIWLAPSTPPSARAWLAIVAVGVVCTGVAYILFFRLVANAGPAKALAVTYAVPVFAVAYGALFLHEAITPWMLFCGAVIVLGTALSTGAIGARATGR